MTTALARLPVLRSRPARAAAGAYPASWVGAATTPATCSTRCPPCRPRGTRGASPPGAPRQRTPAEAYDSRRAVADARRHNVPGVVPPAGPTRAARRWTPVPLPARGRPRVRPEGETSLMGVTRRVKIVCTLGPATSSPERIRGLVEAGMNVAQAQLQPRQPRRPRGGLPTGPGGRRGGRQAGGHPRRPAGPQDPARSVRRRPARVAYRRLGRDHRRRHHRHQGAGLLHLHASCRTR